MNKLVNVAVLHMCVDTYVEQVSEQKWFDMMALGRLVRTKEEMFSITEDVIDEWKMISTDEFFNPDIHGAKFRQEVEKFLENYDRQRQTLWFIQEEDCTYILKFNCKYVALLSMSELFDMIQHFKLDYKVSTKTENMTEVVVSSKHISCSFECYNMKDTVILSRWCVHNYNSNKVSNVELMELFEYMIEFTVY